MAGQFKPLVIEAGQIRQLAAGDTLDAVVTAKEVVTIESASGVTLNAGDAVYIDSAGKLNLASGGATASKYPIGFVRGQTDGTTSNIAAGSQVEVQTDGIFTISDWTAVLGSSTLSPGTKYYLSSATAGNITATAPSSSNHFIVPIGRAISTTSMYIEVGEPIKLA